MKIMITAKAIDKTGKSFDIEIPVSPVTVARDGDGNLAVGLLLGEAFIEVPIPSDQVPDGFDPWMVA